MPEVAASTDANYERQEDEQDAALEELRATIAAQQAEIERLKAENAQLKRLIHHAPADADGEFAAQQANHLKQERAFRPSIGTAARFKDGKERRQQLSLSLPREMIETVKALRMNASGYFEEKLASETFYQEALATRQTPPLAS